MPKSPAPRSGVEANASQVNIAPTFGLVLTYLFCMPSVADAVSDPTGYPFVYVFRTATGTAGGTIGLTVVLFLLLTMITISAAASTSRQAFAYVVSGSVLMAC